ncbi:Conserved_hypothetical protein [Hexamita inflata]|uniref:Uncharacterized protein n=1 Tax=Hexamita inflata TaxID=28002 RepID=A0AA86R780_9EUKA|nr:Conserved hypothetical protein [Hexamita inflata]
MQYVSASQQETGCANVERLELLWTMEHVFCALNALNVSDTCTCPTNSALINNVCRCNVIAGQIMNNGVCKCRTIGAFVDNGACVCALNALNVSDTCTCPTNSVLINNVCTCDQILGQQIVNGSCQCPSGYSVVNDSCKQSYEIYIYNFQCSQEIFVQSFDIVSTTHQITASSNFSAGYVFSTSTIIQNAFIDISDNVYSTTVYPLVQSQSTLTNLKIQFGTQTFNSGSLLLSSFSISINQINIISRPGRQLTVNFAQLNIITPSSSSANITNLLVNLSFAPSSGNITLINNINGVFNVSGYQVFGTYINTGLVSMLGLNIVSATVNVNQVSFKSIAFNVGNCSSYLFGKAEMSTIQINNFAVILGNSSNFLLLGSISTTSTSISYRFGGIIANINSNSVVNVNNVIIDSYQQFITTYVQYSGFLVGQNIVFSSSITIQNVCIQQNITGSTTKFYNLGLIGHNDGNSSVRNASVAFTVQGAYFHQFGIIGYQGNSIYAEVLSVRTSVSVSYITTGYNVGSLFGQQNAYNCSVQNTSVAGGSLNSTYNIGGFIGLVQQNLTVMNSSIQQTNISGQNYVGGFVGFQSGQLHLTNSKIQSVRISGSQFIGIVSGCSGTINFTNSSSVQINVNNSLKGDCVALSNRDGC